MNGPRPPRPAYSLLEQSISDAAISQRDFIQLYILGDLGSSEHLESSPRTHVSIEKRASPPRPSGTDHLVVGGTRSDCTRKRLPYTLARKGKSALQLVIEARIHLEAQRTLSDRVMSGWFEVDSPYYLIFQIFAAI